MIGLCSASLLRVLPAETRQVTSCSDWFQLHPEAPCYKWSCPFSHPACLRRTHFNAKQHLMRIVTDDFSEENCWCSTKLIFLHCFKRSHDTRILNSTQYQYKETINTSFDTTAKRKNKDLGTVKKAKFFNNLNAVLVQNKWIENLFVIQLDIAFVPLIPLLLYCIALINTRHRYFMDDTMNNRWWISKW